MRNNKLNGGSSFLENAFPFWALDDDEIQEENERIAAEAAARENIDKEEVSASTDTKDAGGTGSTSGGGTINIGSINIGGDVHVHMDTDRSRRDSRSSRHSSDDDDVIDVDFVDVADRTTVPKKPASATTPSAPTRQSSQSLSKKQELTKFIRMGDFDALKKLDQLIKSRDVEKLIELFSDNRPLCLWIKRATQQKRWDLLPVIVQELVNQQTS